MITDAMPDGVCCVHGRWYRTTLGVLEVSPHNDGRWQTSVFHASLHANAPQWDDAHNNERIDLLRAAFPSFTGS